MPRRGLNFLGGGAAGTEMRVVGSRARVGRVSFLAWLSHGPGAIGNLPMPTGYVSWMTVGGWCRNIFPRAIVWPYSGGSERSRAGGGGRLSVR